MIRRPGVDDVTRSAVYGDDADPGIAGPGQPGDGRRGRSRPWSGAGGRWLVWVLRAVVWAAIIIIGYRGVMAIALNETPASRSGSAVRPAGQTGKFPATLAEAYALQFGAVYLNFTPGDAGARAKRLASFLPPNVASADPQLGWNGSGDLRLESEQVAGVSVKNSTNAVVTLLGTVNNHLMELGVPVYAGGGGMVVSGEPAWLAAPAQTSPPAPQAPQSDPAAQSALRSQLPAFFQAYGSGDSATLNRFLAPGASVSGLGGALSFDSLSSLYVPAGGATRHITATVIWQLAGQPSSKAAKIEMTYDLTVADEQSGKWYVEDIHASTEGTQAAQGAGTS